MQVFQAYNVDTHFE